MVHYHPFIKPYATKNTTMSAPIINITSTLFILFFFLNISIIFQLNKQIGKSFSRLHRFLKVIVFPPIKSFTMSYMIQPTFSFSIPYVIIPPIKSFTRSNLIKFKCLHFHLRFYITNKNYLQYFSECLH